MKKDDLANNTKKQNEDANIIIMKRSMKKKAWMRIIVLYVLIIVLIVVFNYVRISNLEKQEINFQNGAVINLQTTQCMIHIYDSGLSDFLSPYAPNPSDSSENGKITYAVGPGLVVGLGVSSYSFDSNLNQHSINNQLSYKNCQINIILYKQTILEQLSIKCTNYCPIMINSTRLTTKFLNIEANDGQINSGHINTIDLNIKINKGRVQLTYLNHTGSANIINLKGDSIIQTSKSIDITWQHASPSYCFSAPQYLNKTKTGCEQVSSKEINIAIQQGESNVFKPSCWGNITLCEAISSCGSIRPKLFFQAKYGNIYANIIAGKGFLVNENNQLFKDNITYQTDNIDWSIPTKNIIQKLQTQIDLPTTRDPIILYLINGRDQRSDNQIQFQVSYNPVFSYLKPWWMKTISAGLMAPDQFVIDAQLNPGFCPYNPILTNDQIFNIETLLQETYKFNLFKLITFSWQNELELPKNYRDYQSHNYFGYRPQFNPINNEGNWYQIIKSSQNNYQSSIILLNNLADPLIALIVSIILSAKCGFLGLIFIIFLITQQFVIIIGSISDKKQYITQLKNKIVDKSPTGQIIDQTQKKKLKNYSEDDLLIKNTIKEMEELKNNSFSTNVIIRSIIMFFYRTPPISAFADLYLEMLRKQYFSNSIKIFYNILFSEKQANDTEIQSIDKESIKGSQMKEFYEKFCYLNGYRELSLNDHNNINLLADKGFKFIERVGQTQYYVFILLKRSIYNNEIPKLTKKMAENDKSLSMFIQQCCELSQFECDSIDVQIFNKYYNMFCQVNHIEIYHASEAELFRKFGIKTKFLLEQWVEVDVKYASSSKYEINTINIKNIISLQQKETKYIKPEEIKEANKHLVEIPYWYFYDLLYVLIHFTIIILIGSPILLLTIFQRVNYRVYSLYNYAQSINEEDLRQTFFLLPEKIFDDHLYVQVIGVVTCCFWVMGILDLTSYYYEMVFPIENFFNYYKKRKSIIIWRIMWFFVLIQVYLVAMYFFLIIIWFILGAIVNPNAYLPFASISATFITSIFSKYKELLQLAIKAEQKIMEIIQEIGQKGLILVNSKLQNVSTQMIGNVQISDEMIKAYDLAKSNGFIDDKQHQLLQNNISIISRDPDRIKSLLPPEICEIASDPRSFIDQMKNKTIDLIINQLKTHVDNNFPDLNKITQLVVYMIIKPDPEKIQSSLLDLILQGCQKSKNPVIKSLQYHQILMIMDFAFLKFNNSKYQEIIYENVSTCMHYLINQSIEDKNNKILPNEINQPIEDKKDKIHLKTIQNCFNIFSSLETSILLQSLNEINKLDQGNEFLKPILKFEDFINLVFNCFESNEKRQSSLMYSQVKKFMTKFEIIKEENDNFFDLILILLNNFNRQSYQISTKDLKIKVDKWLQSKQNQEQVDFDINYEKILTYHTTIYNQEFLKEQIIDEQEMEQESKDLKKILDGYKNEIAAKIETKSMIVTLGFNFFRGHFSQIPEQCFTEILNSLGYNKSSLQKKDDISSSILFQGMFDTVELCLQDFKNMQKDIKNIGLTCYQIPESMATLVSYFFLARYNNVLPYEQLIQLQQEKLFQILAKKIQLDSNCLMGILLFVTGRTNNQYVQEFYEKILEVNQIDKKRYQMFHQLYILFSSNNAQELFRAFEILKLDTSYVKFLLIVKGVIDQKHIQDSELEKFKIEKEKLKNKKKNLNPKKKKEQKENLNPKKKKEWIKKLLKDLKKKNLSGVNQDISQINMLQIGILSFYAKNTITRKILNYFSNENNNINQFSEKEIYVLDKIVQLRVINPNKDWSNKSGAAVRDLSKIININQNQMEQFFSLFCDLNPDKLYQSLWKLQLLSENSTENYDYMYEYLQYAVDKCKSISKTFDFSSKTIPKVFKEAFPLPQAFFGSHVTKPEDQEDLTITIQPEIIQRIFYRDDYDININCFYNIINQLMIKNKENKNLIQVSDFLLNYQESKQIQIEQILPQKKQQIEGLQYLQILPQKKQQIEGLQYFLKMLNGQDKHHNIDQLMNMFSKYRNKNTNKSMVMDIFENNKQQYETYKIFSAFYLFFSGQTEEVLIDKKSVIEYLKQETKIPAELFENLYLIFLDNNSIISKQYIEYFKRLNYQENLNQKKLKKLTKIIKNQQQKNNKISQSDLSKQQSVNKQQKNKISQSDLSKQQSVNIDQRLIHEFLNLISSQPFISSIFSREFKFEIEVIDLIALLTKINNQKQTDKDNRKQLYDEIKCNQNIVNVLLTLQVIPEDLINLLMILYGDYEIHEDEEKSVMFIQQAFNMQEVVHFDILYGLLQIDYIFDSSKTEQQTSTENVQYVKEKLANSMILDEKHLNVNLEWTGLGIQLAKGNFRVLRKYVGQFKSLQMPEIPKGAPIAKNQRESMIQTICGIFGSQDESFYITDLWNKINEKLKCKFPQNDSDIIPKKNGTKQIFKQKNKLSYAIYLLVKNLRLDPIWFLLFIGDKNAWNYIINQQYQIIDSEEPFLNPCLILVIVLNMKALPCIYKEILSDYQWVQNHQKMQKDDNLKELFNKLPDKIFEKYLETNKKIFYQIVNNFTFNFVDLQQFAKDTDFNQIIFQQLEQQQQTNQEIVFLQMESRCKLAVLIDAIQQNNIFDENQKDKKDQYQKLAIECQKKQQNKINIVKFFLDSVKEQNDRLLFKEYIKKHFKLIIIEKCINKVKKLCIDPRGENTKLKDDKSNIEEYLRQNVSQDAMFYELGVLSSMSCMRKAYYKLQGRTQRDADHVKLAAIHTDYILSSIEKFNIYSTMTEFFSKFITFNFFGLSAGLLFHTDELIKDNILNQEFSPEEKIKDLFKLYDDESNEKKQLIQKKIQFKVDWIIINLSNKLFFRTDQIADYYDYSNNYQDMYDVQEQLVFHSSQYNQQNEYKSEKCDNWIKMCENNQFKTLIDIARDNYQSILNDSYFTTNTEYITWNRLEVQFYCGILGLTGSPFYHRKRIDYEEFSNYIDQITDNINSDNKALAEILSFLLPGTNKGWNILSDTYNENKNLLDAFTKIAMNDYFNFNKNLRILVNGLNNLDKDKQDILLQMLKAYKGDFTNFYSTDMIENQLQQKIFKKILSSLNQAFFHGKQKIQFMKFDFFSNTVFSFDPDTNKQQLLKLIWQMSIIIKCPQKDDDIKIIKQKEKNDEVKLLLESITDLLDGDLSFLFKEKYEKSLKYIFEIVESDDIKIMQSLCLIRPQKISLQTKDDILKKIDNYQTILIESKIIDFRKDTNKQNSNNLEKIESEKIESEQIIFINLLLGITCNSIPKIIEAYKLSEKYSNKYIALLIESFFMWKNLSTITSSPDEYQKYVDKIYKSLIIIPMNINKQLQKLYQIQQLPDLSQIEKVGKQKNIEKEVGKQKNIEKEEQELFNMLIANKDSKPFWYLWNSGLKKVGLNIKNSQDKQDNLIFNIMNGTYFKQEMKKQEFTKRLYYYYKKGSLQIQSKQKFDIEELPNCIQTYKFEELLAQFYNKKGIFKNFKTQYNPETNIITEIILKEKSNEQNPETKKIEIQNNFFKMFIEVQQTKHELNLITNNQDLRNISETLSSALIFCAKSSDEQINKIVFDLINNLLLLKSDKITKNEFQQYQVNLLNQIIFDKKYQVSAQDIFDIYQRLQKLFEIKHKKMYNEEYKNIIIQLIQNMTGGSLPIKMIESIFWLAFCNNIYYLYELLKHFEVIDESNVVQLEKYIQLLNKSMDEVNQIQSIEHIPTQSLHKQNLNNMMKASKLSADDIFNLIDNDKNKQIDHQEFKTFMTRMGWNLSEHRILEIFANVKKQSINLVDNDETQLNREEFGLAYDYLLKQNSQQALDQLLLSLSKLTNGLIQLAFILMLMFTFIYFGIRGFSLGGSFGAVVNSLLPILGGTGITKGWENQFTNMSDEDLKNLVEKIKEILANVNL